MGINKEFLIEEYINKEKSSIIIAKENNLSKSCILKKLKEFGIFRRTQSKAQVINLRKKENHPMYKNISENELIKLYLVEKKTTIQIAKLFNVTNQCIRKKLKDLKVEIRAGHKRFDVVWNKGKTMKDDFRIIKLRDNNPRYRKDITQEIIHKNYILEKKNMQKIAEELNTSCNLISRRLKKFGIKVREMKSVFGYRHRLKCDDGHLVRSTTERELDNWLFHNGIIHVYDKKIGYGAFRTDFYIPNANIWIEYWGLQDIKTYKEKTKRKVEMYKKLGLNLLSLFPFDNVRQKLNFLLQYSESQKVLEDFR